MVSMSVALYNTSRAMLFVGIVGIEEVEKLVEETLLSKEIFSDMI